MKTDMFIFHTSTIYNWYKLLYDDKFKTVITDSLKYLVDEKAIKVYGFVIMPNHIHLLLKLMNHTEENTLFHRFKSFTAHQFQKLLRKEHPEIMELYQVNEPNRKYRFWQRDGKNIIVVSKKIMEQKLDYIHLNPLQSHWNLVDSPELYYFSSAKFYEFGIDDFNFLSHYADDM